MKTRDGFVALVPCLKYSGRIRQEDGVVLMGTRPPHFEIILSSLNK